MVWQIDEQLSGPPFSLQIPDELRNNAAEFAPYYRGNRFILTSRPRGYEGEAEQRLSSLYAECTIRDFDDEDMTVFARSGGMNKRARGHGPPAPFLNAMR